jgi:hypothetical protein
MRKARVILFVAAAGLWPAAAHAGFLAWLEELSGPGPFRGEVVSFTIACVGPDGVKPCATERPCTRQTIVLRLGRLASGDGPRFKDLPADDADNRGKMTVVPVTGLYLFRLHRSLLAGPGAGFMVVSGRGFSTFSRLVLTPVSVSFTPLELVNPGNSHWKRLVRLELDTSFVPQGFKGSDFGNARTTFDSGPEFLTRGAAIIDLGAFFGTARTFFHR